MESLVRYLGMPLSLSRVFVFRDPGNFLEALIVIGDVPVNPVLIASPFVARQQPDRREHRQQSPSKCVSHESFALPNEPGLYAWNPYDGSRSCFSGLTLRTLAIARSNFFRLPRCACSSRYSSVMSAESWRR